MQQLPLPLLPTGWGDRTSLRQAAARLLLSRGIQGVTLEASWEEDHPSLPPLMGGIQGKPDETAPNSSVSVPG